MEKQYNRIENDRPQELKKLGIPAQIDLYVEDGTVYHVRRFFTGVLVIGDLLDALTIEKLEREQRIPALCPVESIAVQWYNNCNHITQFFHDFYAAFRRRKERK